MARRFNTPSTNYSNPPLGVCSDQLQCLGILGPVDGGFGGRLRGYLGKYLGGRGGGMVVARRWVSVPNAALPRPPSMESRKARVWEEDLQPLGKKGVVVPRWMPELDPLGRYSPFLTDSAPTWLQRKPLHLCLMPNHVLCPANFESMLKCA